MTVTGLGSGVYNQYMTQGVNIKGAQEAKLQNIQKASAWKHDTELTM